jgi:hypothetical protein
MNNRKELVARQVPVAMVAMVSTMVSAVIFLVTRY